jgi:hypothetical protein
MEGRCEEIPVTVTPKVKQGLVPCDFYIEVTLPAGCRLSMILLQNHYTSSISIKQRLDSPTKFVTVLKDYRLMTFPHFENDAQNWHIIPVTQFNSKFNQLQCKVVRVYLKQLSPNWVDYNIKNIKCFSVVEAPRSTKVEFKSKFDKFKADLKAKAGLMKRELGQEAEGLEQRMFGVQEVRHVELADNY